ncbi:hypothetical protein D3C80_354020 [compost metagenome]
MMEYSKNQFRLSHKAEQPKSIIKPNLLPLSTREVVREAINPVFHALNKITGLQIFGL